MPLFGRTTDYGEPIGMVIFAKVDSDGPYELIVKDADGKQVEGELTHPKRSACFDNNGGLVCLAPNMWLQEESVYTCLLKIAVGGKTHQFKWYFRTGVNYGYKVK
ncbi:MAG: hypothetical protein Kow00107_05950 [Planctomycetota bacterium]